MDDQPPYQYPLHQPGESDDLFSNPAIQTDMELGPSDTPQMGSLNQPQSLLSREQMAQSSAYNSQQVPNFQADQSFPRERAFPAFGSPNTAANISDDDIGPGSQSYELFDIFQQSVDIGPDIANDTVSRTCYEHNWNASPGQYTSSNPYPTLGVVDFDDVPAARQHNLTPTPQPCNTDTRGGATFDPPYTQDVYWQPQQPDPTSTPSNSALDWSDPSMSSPTNPYPHASMLAELGDVPFGRRVVSNLPSNYQLVPGLAATRYENAGFPHEQSRPWTGEGSSHYAVVRRSGAETMQPAAFRTGNDTSHQSVGQSCPLQRIFPDASRDWTTSTGSSSRACVDGEALPTNPTSQGVLSADMDLLRITSRAPSEISGTPSEISVTPSDVQETLPCDVENCSVIFTGVYRRSNFRRHKRLKHTVVVYPCGVNECLKTFNRQDARLKHQRKHHAHELPLLKPPLLRKRRYSTVSQPEG